MLLKAYNTSEEYRTIGSIEGMCRWERGEGHRAPQFLGNFKKVGHAVGALTCIGKFDQISTGFSFIWLV